MANKTSKIANKYCLECGQKNYRPQRSIKELLVEFAEDWLGYDSKLFQTAKTLLKPAALSLDYFANSHHKNHYITPIRLYLLLSVIFFVMTQFAGFNITEIELSDGQIQITETETNVEVKAESTDKTKADATTQATPTQNYQESPGTDVNLFSADSDFNSERGCLKSPEQIINIWPHWADRQVDSRIKELCESYKNLSYLPKEQQKQARAQWGLKIGQNAIEVLPQAIFFALPLLAFLLGIFYFRSKNLYVGHLVLLMHSHSFIFAVILLYLGWFRLSETVSWIAAIPLGPILTIGSIIYIFLTQKRFYETSFWSTLWRFLLFGFLYSILLTFVIVITSMVGIISSN